MSATCTLTIHTPTKMATASITASASFSRRYTRAQSSPVPPSTSSSGFTIVASPSGSSKNISAQSSRSDKTLADPVSKLAALPSLSKSLNHLPSLGPQSGKEIPVYEGMPSRAQKSSHEKLKMALGNSPSPKEHTNDKNGFYSSPFFSMTPVHAKAPMPQPRSFGATSSHQKQKMFILHSDEEDDADY